MKSLTSKDLKHKPSDLYKLIKDFEKLFNSAFDMQQKNPLNLKWTGDDLKIQRFRATETTIKETVENDEWERHNNLLELLILKVYQMGFQDGQLVTANDYENQFDEVIKQYKEMEKISGYTDKGKITAETEIELCQRLSLRHSDAYYKRLSKKLKIMSVSEQVDLDDLLFNGLPETEKISDDELIKAFGDIFTIPVLETEKITDYELQRHGILPSDKVTDEQLEKVLKHRKNRNK